MATKKNVTPKKRMTQSKVLDHLTARTGLKRQQVRECFTELYELARSNRELILPGFGLVRTQEKKDESVKGVRVGPRGRTRAFTSRTYAQFELFTKGSRPLAELESEFESLLASMQTIRSKRAVRTAFESSPTKLGQAAVKQASKKR